MNQSFNVMQQELTNTDLLQFLKKNHFKGGFVDLLKVQYRPLICPFVSLIKMVKAGDKVGDVGCGSGQFLYLVNEFASASSLYGIEISEKLISNAESLLPGKAQFEKYDGSHFPSRLQQMDIIFLIDVLHHVPKNSQDAFLLNLSASMKPGARLVIKDIDGDSALVYFNKLHDLIFAREIGHELPAENVKSQVKNAGLEITDFEKRNMYVYPHYTIVARKP